MDKLCQSRSLLLEPEQEDMNGTKQMMVPFLDLSVLYPGLCWPFPKAEKGAPSCLTVRSKRANLTKRSLFGSFLHWNKGSTFGYNLTLWILMLTLHTAQGFSMTGNSVVHGQQFKNLTGSSVQDTRKVLSDVSWYLPGLLGDKQEEDLGGGARGKDSLQQTTSVPMRVLSLGQCEALDFQREEKERCAERVWGHRKPASPQASSMLCSYNPPFPLQEELFLLNESSKCQEEMKPREQEKPEGEESRRRICSPC